MIALSHRSLTLRLTALFATTSTAVLVAIGYLFGSSMDLHFLHEDAMELRGKTELVRYLLGKLHAEGDVALLDDRLQEALIGHETLFVSIRDPAGRLLAALLGVAGAAPEEREPELLEAAGRR